MRLTTFVIEVSRAYLYVRIGKRELFWLRKFGVVRD